MTWQFNSNKVKIGFISPLNMHQQHKYTVLFSDSKVLKIATFESDSKRSVNWTFNASPLAEVGKEGTPYS
jgi:hypothetical protein